MEFNDVNQWHRVTDRGAYERAGRQMIEIRCMSGSNGTMYTDTAFQSHRDRFRGFPRLYYFFPYNKATAEVQADWFADRLGHLDPTEMMMLDIEAGSKLRDPVDFTRRFLARVEWRLPGNKSWVYVPKALASPALYRVIGDRVVVCPRYSGHGGRGAAPDWGHWDVHQFTDRGWMPGSPDGPGDVNWSKLSVPQLFARSKVHNEDNELTPQERQCLFEIRDQLCGPR